MLGEAAALSVDGVASGSTEERAWSRRAARAKGGLGTGPPQGMRSVLVFLKRFQQQQPSQHTCMHTCEEEKQTAWQELKEEKKGAESDAIDSRLSASPEATAFFFFFFFFFFPVYSFSCFCLAGFLLWKM